MRSGRSWASPAQRRGSILPVHNIYTHVSQQTTSVILRHDNTAAENKKNNITAMMIIITLILRGDIIEQQRSGWWWEACNSDSCDSPPSLPHPSRWGHRILEDSSRSEREANVFMQRWFPITTRTNTHKNPQYRTLQWYCINYWRISEQRIRTLSMFLWFTIKRHVLIREFGDRKKVGIENKNFFPIMP